MVANGHHWSPKSPEYRGQFTGTYMHSHDFKGIDDSWRGQSVLVIGAGNSACDIAVESARLAEQCRLSMRSPQWFVPKFMFGKPSDVTGARLNFLPRKVKQWLMTGSATADAGFVPELRPAGECQAGAQPSPDPEFGPARFHPAWPHHAEAGGQRYDGDWVEFADGSRQRYDRVCAATGFWISFPFFDKALIDFQHAEKVPLLFKMMHADFDNLVFHRPVPANRLHLAAGRLPGPAGLCGNPWPV